MKTINFFKKIFLAAVVLFGSVSAMAQNLVTWDVSDNGSSWVTQFAAASFDPNVTVTPLVRGSGLGTSGTPANYAFGGSGADQTTLANAITNGDYFTMTIKANAGYEMSLTGIPTWYTRMSGNGTCNIYVQYSLNGGEFADAGSISVTSTSGAGGATPLAAFSSGAQTALSNLPSTITVTLRLVVVSSVNRNIYIVMGNAANATDRLALAGTIQQSGGSLSTDATLKSLKVGADAITLVAGKFNYDYELPYGTTVMPTITAETNFAGATIDWAGATLATIPGIEDETGDVTTFDVIAEDATTIETYSITFTINTTPTVTNVLAAWETNGASLGGTYPFVATTASALINNTPEIILGNGVAKQTSSPAANTYPIILSSATANETAAITNNTYWEFSISTKPNTKLTISEIDVNLRRSASGPNSFRFYYSLDGFTTAGIPINAATAISVSAGDGEAFAFDNLSIDNITGTITIRLYVWGGSAGASNNVGIGRLAGNDLVVKGYSESDIPTFEFNPSADNISAYSANSAIYLSNLPESSTIYVYDIAGQLLVSQKANAANAVLPVAQKGLLLVKIVSGNNSKTIKVNN